MPPEVSRNAAGLSTLTAQGDWNDVQAAVAAAATHNEIAVVNATATSDQIQFELVSVEGEPGELVVRRVADSVIADAAQPYRAIGLVLEAKLGLFRRPEPERQFLQDVERRLAQLRGVDAAPLSPGW